MLKRAINWKSQPEQQNARLIMLNNFNYDQRFLKNKSQGLKRQLSGTISEEAQNGVSE